MTRPEPLKVAPTCAHCGSVLPPVTNAIACSDKGSVLIPLPSYCTNKQCRKERDEIAIERAIEKGIITR